MCTQREAALQQALKCHHARQWDLKEIDEKRDKCEKLT